MAGSKNPVVYIITSLPNATNGTTSQATTWNNNSASSRVAGIGGVGVSFLGDVSKAGELAAIHTQQTIQHILD